MDTPGDAATTVDTFAICARVARNTLVAAECAALTDGVPDDDGVAPCADLGRIGRGAYVQSGVQVLTRARTFDDLLDAIARLDLDADRFRIDVHDPADHIGMRSIDVAIAVADVVDAFPDLRDPLHRFVVISLDGHLVFGEVVVAADQSYRRHDTKPWTTSSSLDSRLARALVNLVPEARSILDPCCGAGSIVIEAAALGVEAYGVDWKPAMVGMTQENLSNLGYTATVEQADSRTHIQCADAVVTDLPYGHALTTDEPTIRAILEQAAALAPTAVFVAPADISPWLDAAGYVDIATHTVNKRRGFTRWVHTAASRQA